MSELINQAKLAATKLVSKYQTERWFNGISIDPTPDGKVGVFLYMKHQPLLSVLSTIPQTIDGIPVVTIDETKV